MDGNLEKWVKIAHFDGKLTKNGKNDDLRSKKEKNEVKLSIFWIKIWKSKKLGVLILCFEKEKNRKKMRFFQKNDEK